MRVLGAFLLIGLLLGWGLGGGLRNLAEVRIRLWYLAPVGVALQAAPVPELSGAVGRRLPVAALLGSLLILLVVAAVNWRLRGFVLIFLGLALNFAVIAANRGMPVSEAAVREVGGSEAVEELRRAEDAKHHAATEDDVLRFLGDVISVQAPFREVVSVGDVVAYAGAGSFIAAAMLNRPVRRPLEPETPPLLPRRATGSGTRR